MPTTPSRLVEIVEQVVAILDHGSFTSTYKQAVLLALVDLCKELTGPGGGLPQTVTTRQLAQKVVELYWPQTLLWRGQQVLSQNASGLGKIVALVQGLRAFVSTKFPGTVSLVQVQQVAEPSYREVVEKVEWILIEKPLPKLQRVGGMVHNWLYTINWNDTDNAPRKGAVRAYQREDRRSFDNRIFLAPEVAECFVAMHAILRPLIMQHWAMKVANLNTLDVTYLHDFMFGADRPSLEPIRRDLRKLQDGRCFYCRATLPSSSHVDHFIPWSRHPENGIHNLVVSHRGCNTSKSNLLAAHEHVQRWRTWIFERHDDLSDIANRRTWPADVDRVVAIARAVYSHAPDRMSLWQASGALVPVAAQKAAILATLQSRRG